MRRFSAIFFRILACALLAVGPATLLAQNKPDPKSWPHIKRSVPPPPRLPESMGPAFMKGLKAGGGESLQSEPERCAPSPPASPVPAPALPPPALPVPEATDATSLTVTKSWNGSGWDITLSWGGGTPTYTVSWCPDPTFQSGVQTLAKDSTLTGLTVAANASTTLECFAVTDSTIVSPAVQGMGYDPEPAPAVPTLGSDGLWWGDSITLIGNYMDLIPKGNVVAMYDRPVRATTATGSGEYATSALFDIPDDTRGFYAFVQSHGRTCDPSTVPFLSLYPRGIGPFTAITGVTYVPQSGHIWVSAEGVAQEVDLFLHDPVVVPGRNWTSYTYPYISRVTNDNRILIVDGVYGVTTIDQVDLSTGIKAQYALTHDSSFTRNIWPVGIAVDPDGSCCYVADYYYGSVVKIPAGAGSGSTIVDVWGGYYWNLPDPCGMDVNIGHQVFVASDDSWIGRITGQYTTYLNGYTEAPAHSIQVDKDVSTTSYGYIFYTTDLAVAEVFNKNAIGGYPVRNHGGALFGIGNGNLALDPDWFNFVYHHFPQRVILNNSGETTAYPSQYQDRDRVIEMLVTGWAGTSLQLRVIDPPDLSPYAPYGGYPARHDTAVPPYEANDNFGTTDYGISLSSDGSGAQVSGVYPIPSGGALTFYLEVPARYSGDNFQVEVTKCNASAVPIPTHIAGLSSVYTPWKRVFVERDKMFRKGGLLYQSYGSPSGGCGSGTLPPCCTDSGQLPCDQIKVYDWSNAVAGNTIAIFDEVHTFEVGAETRSVQDVTDNADGTKTITLDTPLSKTYEASEHTGTPPMPTFTATAPDTPHSGGVGVISGCDSASNQINSSSSCFYDGDMRDIQQPFDDAYVEFYGQRAGMNALPLLSESCFLALDDLTEARFSQIWFAHFQNGGGNPPIDNAHNYFHLMGVTKWGTTGGYSLSDWDLSFAFIQGLETIFADPTDRWLAGMAVVDHELVHQFDTNRCSDLINCETPPPASWGHHDYRGWWLYGGTGCPSANPCLMDPNGGNMTDSTNRLCLEDLLLGDPNCPDPVPPDTKNGAIRTEFDPK